jgi:hypothetical protein
VAFEPADGIGRSRHFAPSLDATNLRPTNLADSVARIGNRIAIQSVCVTIPSISRADAVGGVKDGNVFGGFATGMDFKKFSKN